MNLIELSNKFPTELEAVKYLEKKRWGKTVQCPYCDSKEIGNRQKDMRFPCDKCRRSFSVTTSTNLHNTRLPIKTWLMSFALITDAKKGISAMQLQRNIGVHYETAWNMYHKIRDLMSIENNGIRLDDIVELDSKQVDVSMRKCQEEKKGTPKYIPELDEKIEQYSDRFTFKEGNYKKPCKVGKQKTGEGASDLKIGGAAQRNGNVVAHVIKNTKFSELRKIIDKHVNKNRKETILLTDEARGSRRMKEIINHIAIDHFRMYSYRGLNTNTIESFWAIIERQIVGQHHHVDLKYLEKYVAEAVFKFNNRKIDDMFETLVEIALKTN